MPHIQTSINTMYTNNEIISIMKNIVKIEKDLKKKRIMLDKIVIRLQADENMLKVLLNS